MTFKLMIKTHNITGLKYLCVTSKDDYGSYSGSGHYWKSHIKTHGKDIFTELLGTYQTKEELRDAAILASAKYDVVESSEWANLIPETGYDYDGITRKGWFGWYESLSDEEIQIRNANISLKVKERISNTDPNIISAQNRKQRLNISKEAAKIRKTKIQDVYNTGKHDALFKRYSEERTGGNNPCAKIIMINKIQYACIKDAVHALNLTRAVISRRIKSDHAQWSEWNYV
jgi:hypothetical protein